MHCSIPPYVTDSNSFNVLYSTPVLSDWSRKQFIAAVILSFDLKKSNKRKLVSKPTCWVVYETELPTITSTTVASLGDLNSGNSLTVRFLKEQKFRRTQKYGIAEMQNFLRKNSQLNYGNRQDTKFNEMLV